MDTENISSVELRALCYKICRIKFIYELNEQKVKKRTKYIFNDSFFVTFNVSLRN